MNFYGGHRHMDNVLKFINNLNINENDTVVVSCSYGPDSMYMLYIMHTYYKCKVVCAHVNHKMRQASEQEFIDLKSMFYNWKQEIINSFIRFGERKFL